MWKKIKYTNENTKITTEINKTMTYGKNHY